MTLNVLQLYSEQRELTPNCLGFIRDSESANKKALAELEVEHPFLINLTCQAHGLSNLVKVSHSRTNPTYIGTFVHQPSFI